jgi:oxygen-dependent protoporphyrinogen oxidase
MADTPHWIVVGGGIAGLLAARRLARTGDRVTVLEATDHVGGRVSSLELDGLTLDAGAESFATRGDTVAALLSDLGLEHDVVSPAPTPAWVVTENDAYPLPSTGWLGIPLRPFAAEVRRVIGWRGAWRAWSDYWRPLGAVDPDITVGELVRARLGEQVADRLVTPVVAGVYSRPIDELALAAIDPGLPAEVARAGGVLKAARARREASPAGSAVQGIVGGLNRLTDALAASVRDAGVEIVMRAPVVSIERNGATWKVKTDHGTCVGTGVVLAVPLSVARQWIPALPAAEARWVALVTLVLDAPELDDAPRGTGVLVQGSVTRAKALTHATAKWPWLANLAGKRHIVRLSYRIDGPDEDVTPHARADAARLLSVALDESQVLAITQVVWPDASPAKVDPALVPEGMTVVGSAAGLSGLAAIVAADLEAGSTAPGTD